MEENQTPSKRMKRGLPSRLPLDIFLSILSKLPVRSLLRLQCVSKSMCELISFPTRSIASCHQQASLPLAMSGFFGHRPSSETNPAERILFASFGPTIYANLPPIDTTLHFLPLPEAKRQYLTIKQSCCGLLLPSNYDFRLLVCNPATRRWVEISEPPAATHDMVLPIFLAFDPNRSMHYKVVSFPDWSWDGNRIEVFSSETGRWMDRQLSPLGNVGGQYDVSLVACFSNGLLYVMANSLYTLVIDLDKNIFWRIECPAIEESLNLSGCRLGHSQGLLHLAIPTMDDEMIVWLLEDPMNRQYVLKRRFKVKDWNEVEVDGGKEEKVEDSDDDSDDNVEDEGGDDDEGGEEGIGGGGDEVEVHRRNDVMWPIAFHPDLDVMFFEEPNGNNNDKKLLSFYHFGSDKSGEVPGGISVGNGAYVYSPCFLTIPGLSNMPILDLSHDDDDGGGGDDDDDGDGDMIEN